MLGKMLLVAAETGCAEEALTVAAMLSVQGVFLEPKAAGKHGPSRSRKRFAVREGDHLTLVNVFAGFLKAGTALQWCQDLALGHRALLRATEIRQQLRRHLRRLALPIESCRGDPTRLRRAITAAFFPHAAQRRPDGSYATLRSRGRVSLHVHPSSVLFQYPPPWLLFHEVMHTDKAYMRDCLEIDAAWLPELAPHYYEIAHAELRPAAQ
jgi:ATP-dependent RNA helicase DDX35